MKFIASRLSDGNKIFPAEIHIEENGIKVKIPGFLSGDTKFIDYGNISGIDINTPMVGFSSITFFYHGSRAFAHGFKKEEAQQIKQAVDRGKIKSKTTTVNHNHNHVISNSEYVQPVQQQQTQPVVHTIQEPQNHITSTPIEQNNVSNEISGVYNEQLEKLIEMALADGELTEKEKQILFKKAEGAGIDLDEFEMVLDAKLFEKNKNKVQEIPVAAPKSDKFGDVKKCPSCGAIAESFSTNCGECGYEFRNIEANTSVKLLSSKLESIVIEYDKLSFTENNIFGKFTDNKEKQSERRNIEILERQREAIKNFPIPNTREDILELLYFILPKTKLGFTSDKNVNAWRYKFSEVINRAKIAFNNDKKTLDLILSYEKNIDNSFILKIVSQFNSLSKKAKITIVIIIFFIILSIF